MAPRALILALGIWACDDAAGPATAWVDAAGDQAVPVDLALPDADPGPALLHVGQTEDPRPPDGSRARPHPTPDAAAARAHPGDVIFLLPGSHPRLSALPVGVELLGSGAAVTTLAGPLELDGPGAEISGFSLAGAPLTIAAEAVVRDVTVTDIIGVAVQIVAGAELEDVRVIDVMAPDGAVRVETSAPVRWVGGGAERIAGPAIIAIGATLTLEALDFARIAGFGLFADGGTYLVRDLRLRGAAGAALRFIEAQSVVEGCGIADVAVDPAQNTGSGVGFIAGRGRVQGCQISGVERGLRAALGAELGAEDVRIEGALGDGISVNGAARAELVNVRIDGARNAGISAQGGTLIARDLVIRAVGRLGILVGDGHAELSDLTIEDSDARGITALRSTLSIRDATIRRAADVCIQLTDPLEATRVSFLGLEDCGGAGIGVFGATDTALEISEVDIRGTRNPGEDLAAGIHVYEGHVRVRDSAVVDGEVEGVRLERSRAVIDGLEVADNDGPGLVIIDAQEPIRVDRLVATSNAGAGLLLAEGTALLKDCVVTGTRAHPEIGQGDGIFSAAQGTLDVLGGWSQGNAGSGVRLEGISTGRLRGNVRLEENGAYGVVVGCGSRLEQDDFIARGNGSGPRLECR